jgi:hypothetical protein
MLNQERLKELLRYDPETGLFYWLERPVRLGFERTDKTWNVRYAGKIAGDEFGKLRPRIRISVDKRRFQAHRLAWLWMTGEWPAEEIDHKDMNPLNNKWENLREATHSQNGMNRKSRSKYAKGVTIHKPSGLFQARIYKDGRCRCLGYHKTPEEAHRAYIAAAKDLHGEFARAA